mmetsp:Transcript_1312/g.1779  ORF Transcript_1312/g.1779 Transcript_1312/m.1779 type:complete len:91 (+) Transcript_1312:623-895(+)
MSSLEGVRDDLEYKTAVAASECAKWTDNTLQLCEAVLNHAHTRNSESGGVLSFDQLLQQFPYLERVLADSDMSQISHIYEQKRASLAAAE